MSATFWNMRRRAAANSVKEGVNDKIEPKNDEVEKPAEEPKKKGKVKKDA